MFLLVFVFLLYVIIPAAIILFIPESVKLSYFFTGTA